MPLFSKTKNGGQQDREPRDATDESSEIAPPDEHTRLLPNRVDTSRDSNRNLLTPDDPAVSPYNLWSIRVLRYLTLVFTAITFVWWVLLLVSAFATPPGLHSRGSGFFAFGFTTLTMANLGFVLIFFGVPSKSVRILAFAMAVSSAFCKISHIIYICIYMPMYLSARTDRAYSSCYFSTWFSSLPCSRRDTKKDG